MIDTDKYEGHSEGEWVAVNGSVVIPANEVSEEQVMINTHCAINAQLIADAPLLLAEVKRLQKLEAAVVGSWMETSNRGSDWHKQLRDPCVKLGYLTYDNHWYELSEKYQDMAKEWVKEHYGDDEE